MSEHRRNDLLAWLFLALVPTLFFIDVITGARVLYVRDTSAYHYPMKKMLRDIVAGGEFPWWNPLLSAGQPVAANPAYQVFYPPTWLILLPNFTAAFHALILLHLFLALFGMYALLRSMDLARSAAVFGAVSYAIGGGVLSTLCLYPCFVILAWLPLTCLFTRRYLETRSPRALALAAVCFGMQVLIGEPITAFATGLILGLYAVAAGWQRARVAGVLRHVGGVGVISVAALLIAAVQVLPMLDHFGDSVRSRGFDFDTMVSLWSMPWARLAELFFPNVLGYALTETHLPYWGKYLYREFSLPFLLSIYPGLAVAVLAVAGLFARVRGAALFAAISVTSVILAVGSHTPLLRFLYDIGVARSSRYPEKFALMLSFAAPVFAAVVLDRLLAGDARVRRAAVVVAAATALFALAVVGITLTPVHGPLFSTIWQIRAPATPQVLWLEQRVWLIALARCGILLLLLLRFGRMRQVTWTALLAAFVLIDLGSSIRELVPRQAPSFYSQPPAALQQLPAQRESFRVFHYAAWATKARARQIYFEQDPDLFWVFRNALTPLFPGVWGVRTVFENDFDLTALLPTADFTRSVLDLAEAHVGDWVNVVASASNVRYVVVWEKPAAAFAKAHGVRRLLQPVKLIEGNTYPRYYFSSRMISIRNREDFVEAHTKERLPRDAALVYGAAFVPASGVVRSVVERANGARIEVSAAGRAFLVMSVTPHKYWTVTVDGADTPAVVTNVGYQGVAVPPGNHVVEMRYRNPLVPAGAAISAAALLALFLAGRRKPATATMRAL